MTQMTGARTKWLIRSRWLTLRLVTRAGRYALVVRLGHSGRRRALRALDVEAAHHTDDADTGGEWLYRQDTDEASPSATSS
jgi:hypothetical protein